MQIKLMRHQSKNDELRSKYHKVVDELYETDEFKKSGHELIDSHFEYIRNFTLRVFTKLQEKAILAQGELISTSLFHLLLQERNIKSVLLPALCFMRIDKDGEPDAFYIKENMGRELKKHVSGRYHYHPGVHMQKCLWGDRQSETRRKRFHRIVNWCCC